MQILQPPPDVEEERLKLEYRLMQINLQDKARKDFLSFCNYVWPDAIIGSHHKIMAEAFNKIINGSLKRLIVNMPPRHTKSEFASYLLPAFAMGQLLTIRIQSKMLCQSWQWKMRGSGIVPVLVNDYNLVER